MAVIETPPLGHHLLEEFEKNLRFPMEMVIYYHTGNPRYSHTATAYAVQKEQCVGGDFFADILILDSKYELVEIEVKRSWSDFRRDFATKRIKHDMYREQRHNKYQVRFYLAPHKLYFAFPTEELCDKAKAWLKENGYNHYGIYYVTDNVALGDSRMEIYKRCGRIFLGGSNAQHREFRDFVRNMRTSEWFLSYVKERQFCHLVEALNYLGQKCKDSVKVLEGFKKQ